MPQELIDAGRARDKRAKAAYDAKRCATEPNAECSPEQTEISPAAVVQEGFLSRIAQWLLPSTSP